MAKGGHLQGKAVYLASYFFGPGSNRPLDMIVANVSYYYHRNLEGSITTLTDASGAVQASYHYLTPDSTMGDPYGFGSVKDAAAFLGSRSPPRAPPTTADSGTVGALGGGPTCPPGNRRGHAYGRCGEEITVELFEAMVRIPVTVRGDSVRVLQKEQER